MFGDYEKANWAKLSPKFRDAHNRLRQAKGMETLPPPKVELYVQPRALTVKAYSFDDPEFIAAIREFMGRSMMPASEGFTINGVRRK